MIGSFGGAEIDAQGNRSYKGSGGLVGGLSFYGAGTANFTGAGKFYERFTPAFRASENLLEPIDPIDTGGGYDPTIGGGTTTGGGSPVTSGGGFNLPTISGGNRGFGAIQSGGNSVINALNSIFSGYQSGQLSLQEALLYGQQYAGYLSNSQYFYQAQHGDDASLLIRLKLQASSILNSIRNWIAPVQDGGIKDPPSDQKDPTNIPINVPPSILDLLKGLGVTARTSVEQPANLFSFDPTATGGNSAGNNTMRNLVILAVVAFAGYWLYKKYA